MQENQQQRGLPESLIPFADVYEFDGWRGSSRAEGDLFVAGIRLDGRELPGWGIRSHREPTSPELPRTVRTLWQRAETALLVELYECDDRLEAHLRLLDLLGHVQGPVLERVEPVGDVGFATRGDTGVLFARANLAVAVRNAGAEIVEVREVALRLDEHVSRHPEPTDDVARAPAIRAFRRGQPSGRDRVVSLDVDVEDPEGRDVWLKLFADEGRLFREDGRLMWTGTAPSRLTLYAIAGPAVSTESLALD